MRNHTLTHHQVVTDVDKTVRGILEGKFSIRKLRYKLQYLYAALMSEYNDSLKYDETINWFIATIQVLQGDYYATEITWDAELVYEFVDEIQSYETKYLLMKTKFRSKERRNTQRLTKYINQLVNHYSRVLMVRVDLKYHNSDKTEIGVDEFRDHMRILLERLSNKDGSIKGLEGYAWALEQGYKRAESGGLHCHLLLIYNGAERQSAYYLAKKIGEIWHSITNGRGSYFNSHTSSYIKTLQKIGQSPVAMVHRENSHEVEKLLEVSEYLTTKSKDVDGKFNQRLKLKVPDMKAFGKGQFDIKKRRGKKQ